MGKRTSLRLIPAAVLTALGLASAQDLPTGTIEVQVFGPFGEKISKPQIYLYTPDEKRDLARERQGNRITGVPYGRYLLVASAGSETGERQVVVNTPNSWVILGLEFPRAEGLSPGPPGFLAISGDITPLPGSNEANWWVRVHGIFLSDTREAPIQSNGHFSVADLGMGAYIIEVFDGPKLRHVETVEIDTSQPNTNLKMSLDRAAR